MTAEPSPTEPSTHRRAIPVAVAVAALATVGAVAAVTLTGDGDDGRGTVQRVAVEPHEDPPGDATETTDPTEPSAPPLDTVGPTSPELTVTTMRHDELSFTWTPSVDLPIPGGVGVGGYEVVVDGVVAGLYGADVTEAVVMTTVRTDGEPHFIEVIPIDLNGTRGVRGWATVRRGPELGAAGR